MENVIFTSSPLGAFSGGIFVTLFLLVLGLIALVWAIFRRKERTLARIGMGCASLILLLAGVGISIALAMQWQNGEKQAVVVLNEKKVVKSNCDKPGGVCISYLLETSAGNKNYDFTVSQDAYEKVDESNCYEFTYFPAQSLFGKYLQEQDYSDFYEAVSTITRIEKSICP